MAIKINPDLLQRFERSLDPCFPTRGEIPTRVLGYGEISTVLEIGTGRDQELAYKRMPMFQSRREADDYEALHQEYVRVLQEQVGLRVAPGDIAQITNERTGRVVVYLAQARFPAEAIGHRAIHQLSPAGIERLVQAVLTRIARVFDFNRQHAGELELGLDGQISNWAIVNAPQAFDLGEEIELAYIDTSTPLMRRQGQEQMEPELFLRSAPSFLVWILRLFFLDDVMTRYYNVRQVVIDLAANFYKEQRPDLIPGVIDTINAFWADKIRAGRLKAVSEEEVRAYYRQDAWIWRLYLSFRRVDRAWHRLLGRDYPYILPGEIKR
jgi:hypothetical protein